MTLLAPDIVEAILHGRLLHKMTLAVSMRSFPLEWGSNYALYVSELEYRCADLAGAMLLASGPVPDIGYVERIVRDRPEPDSPLLAHHAHLAASFSSSQPISTN